MMGAEPPWPPDLSGDVVPSLTDPQLEPSDHCWTVLQDFGPDQGGWGPAAIEIPWIGGGPRPFVYTGNAEHVIKAMQAICQAFAESTNHPTKLVRYSKREDVFSSVHKKGEE